jgi:hypothetical protein
VKIYSTAVYAELGADMNRVLDAVPFMAITNTISDGRSRGLSVEDTARKLLAKAGA